jgi:carbonic anhydrase/acetyltransferase-like protein (isoleucine patch superfamily)
MALYELDGVRPELPASGRCFIADSAELIGRIRIGEDANVWFGVVMRGDNELIDIRARANIQDNSVLHTDPDAPLTVEEDVTVGHAAILHGCVIGAGSLVGMGATILNHARIGRGCLVGAGALVTEGREFPDNSLIVGAPAKVLRPLTGEQVARLRESAAHYVANGRRYATGLKRIG